MVGHIMILGEESPSRRKHPGDLSEPGSPVGDMVQHGEVKDCVELSVCICEISDIARHYGDSFPVVGQATTRLVNHS